MKTPADKTIVMTFGSHPMRKASQRWQAELTFPAGSGPETMLPLVIKDGEGVPVASGVFEFAGQRLKVVDGQAALSYADFIKGKHAVPLWLHRRGMPPVPGGLTFA